MKQENQKEACAEVKSSRVVSTGCEHCGWIYFRKECGLDIQGARREDGCEELREIRIRIVVGAWGLLGSQWTATPLSGEGAWGKIC